MIKLNNVSKYYQSDIDVSEGLRKVTLEFSEKEFVAVVGASGSGKTTLINVISGLDGYEAGEIYINGHETSHWSIEDWQQFQNNNVAFVFQEYNVIDSYTVLQNVLLALEIGHRDMKEKKKKALSLIDKVGLTKFLNQKTGSLSGGKAKSSNC